MVKIKEFEKLKVWLKQDIQLKVWQLILFCVLSNIFTLMVRLIGDVIDI